VGLQLHQRVRLAGSTHQPFEVMQTAALFVLPSRFEGFPNALLEAMACGLPVISFDCPYGPREIISEGVDGMLIPPQDVPALTVAMAQLMRDPTQRYRLGYAAQSVRERFHPDAIMSMWEAMLTPLVASPGQSTHAVTTSAQ
jgi:GalNAc-alpha-(1->4)-GalNAc-alpha-(1->3)-diNAcBac-PP-undecaprenol alpha-1,4-N-acetyl-D-galactosaminyltransferase